jgi:outer membrane protein TolC
VLLEAELAQVRTLSIRYAATVDLIRASGGGFWDDEATERRAR